MLSILVIPAVIIVYAVISHEPDAAPVKATPSGVSSPTSGQSIKVSPSSGGFGLSKSSQVLNGQQLKLYTTKSDFNSAQSGAKIQGTSPKLQPQ